MTKCKCKCNTHTHTHTHTEILSHTHTHICRANLLQDEGRGETSVISCSSEHFTTLQPGHTHTLIYIYTHTHTHSYIFIHIHTHTHTLCSPTQAKARKQTIPTTVINI